MLSRYRRGLIQLFEKLRVLSGAPYKRPDLALEIQEELLIRLARTERLLRQTRSQYKEVKRQSRTRHTNKERARDLKKSLTSLRHRLDLLSVVHRLLMDVGDAMVFIYLDRWDVKPLIENNPPGFMSGKTGNRFERRVLREVFRTGGIGILNDMTHSLRMGDVTVFGEEEGATILELKSGHGGDKARQARQMARLDAVEQYLAEDEIKLPEENFIRRRSTPHQEPTFHVAEINRLIRETSTGGSAYTEVEPGLHYFVDQGGAGDGLDSFLASAGQEPQVFFVNGFKQITSVYYPLLLSLDDSDAVYNFYNGDLVIVVAADLERVRKLVEERGYTFAWTNDAGFCWNLVLPDSEFKVAVGTHFVGRIGAEFMSLRWTVEEAMHMLESIYERSKPA